MVVVKVLTRASESSTDSGPGNNALEANLSVPGGSCSESHPSLCESFAVEQCGDAMIVRFVDLWHFDTGKYVRLQEDLIKFVELQKPRQLLVDLGQVECCSTTLINALLMAQKACTRW